MESTWNLKSPLPPTIHTLIAHIIHIERSRACTETKKNNRSSIHAYIQGDLFPPSNQIRQADPPIDEAYLGLVAAAIAGTTADEEEFDSFISPDPIPFAPPRTPLPAPLYPRRWPEVGVPLAASGASSACGSPSGEIGLVRGQSRANRRRRRRAKARRRQELVRRWNYWGQEETG